MPKSVNKVILIGNLGKDPEVKYTPSGTPVAKLTLATNERFKDKGGEWQVVIARVARKIVFQAGRGPESEE